MLLQGWKHLTKILFPPHCCYPLISWSGQSLTDHLANGSPISLCVQTFNLLEDFRAQLPGFSVPGLVIFCNSDVSWSHHSQVTPCILSLFGSLIIKLKQKSKQHKNPLWTRPRILPSLILLQYLCLPSPSFLYPHQSLSVFLFLCNFVFMVQYLGSLFPPLIFFQ